MQYTFAVKIRFLPCYKERIVVIEIGNGVLDCATFIRQYCDAVLHSRDGLEGDKRANDFGFVLEAMFQYPTILIQRQRTKVQKSCHFICHVTFTALETQK